MYIAYKTTNTINGKYYIGIHKQENEDFDGYLGSGMALAHAIEKYGKESFIRETLFSFDSLDEAREKEKEIVNTQFCLREDTYNISIGGTGGNTIAGLNDNEKRKIKEKRKLTAIKNKSFVYTGQKLEDAAKRMKEIRIQPDNKGRKH